MAMLKRGSFDTTSMEDWSKEKQAAAVGHGPRKTFAVKKLPKGAKPLYDEQKTK
jgi:hypothetical protein